MVFFDCHDAVFDQRNDEQRTCSRDPSAWMALRSHRVVEASSFISSDSDFYSALRGSMNPRILRTRIGAFVHQVTVTEWLRSIREQRIYIALARKKESEVYATDKISLSIYSLFLSIDSECTRKELQ